MKNRLAVIGLWILVLSVSLMIFVQFMIDIQKPVKGVYTVTSHYSTCSYRGSSIGIYYANLASIADSSTKTIKYDLPILVGDTLVLYTKKWIGLEVVQKRVKIKNGLEIKPKGIGGIK